MSGRASGWWGFLARRWGALRRRLVQPVSGDPEGPTTVPMAGLTLRLLVAYLLLVAAGGAWLTWTVWTARPPVPTEEPWPDTASAAAEPDVAPTLARLSPDTLVYGAARPFVRVLGSGFSAASRVLVDGQVHPGGRFVATDQMVLELTDADFRQSGTLAVVVTRETLQTRPLALHIRSESEVVVSWRPFPGVDQPITVESRLLLLALLAGVLGGTLASFNSLSNFRGEGKLVQSWSLYYLLSPLVGGGITLLLYGVVRAGLLSGTNVQIDANTTPWGLVAVSGLAGFFYDKTLLKLRELFITLFNPRDDRGAKLDQPRAAEGAALRIVSSALPAARAGVAYTGRLEASGGHPDYSWSVEPDLPGGLTLDPRTGEVFGTPTEARSETTHEFSVTDMERAADKASVKLEVRS